MSKRLILFGRAFQANVTAYKKYGGGESLMQAEWLAWLEYSE